MATRLRIATFNLENLDDKPNLKPSLDQRITLMRPQLQRLDADLLCLQEVNAQKKRGTFQLLALDKLLAGTPYGGFNRVATASDDGSQPLEVRNIVILSRFPVVEHQQIKHQFAPAPSYRRVTAIPPDTQAGDITWDRPILHARIDLGAGRSLHVLNVHLKSKIPTDIPGQKVDNFTWKTAAGLAEGAFLSTMKRVGQALEARRFIDTLFDADPGAAVICCGDFNSDVDDVPLEAIRGDVEDHGNPALAGRVMVPCERTVPEPARFSLIHHGRPEMLDHIVVSRPLLASYRRTEIHNELLHDESVAFADDVKFPESDHAPVVAEFELPDP